MGLGMNGLAMFGSEGFEVGHKGSSSDEMASSQNVELEAAKFLHKLIQDSKDEPAKLATKLYVILQHMKSSGKEHSMPYQVISRAMETVINQHGLDIEALKSSRLPLTGGPQIGSSSQPVNVTKDSRVGLVENEVSKMDPYASGRPPVAPSGGAPDYYQGSVAQRSGQSFDQGSPSSLDSRSANSQSQDKRDTANWDKQSNQKDGKKATTKRKRGDTSSPVELHVDSPQLDPRNTGVSARKGKMTKAELSDGLPVKSGELTNFNMAPNSGQMENVSTLPGSMRTMLRANQEGHHSLAKQTDLTKIGNPMVRAPNSKYAEDSEVSSALIASGKQQGAYAKVHGGMGFPAGASSMAEAFSNSMQYGGAVERDGGSSTSLAEGHKISQVGRQNSGSEMTMLRQGVPPRDTGKSTVPVMPFKEQQLKQLRAQCLVFLAFRNGLAPKKLHLEIALGTAFSREDGSRKDLIDHKGKSQSLNESNNASGVMMPFGGPSNVRQSDKNPSGSSSAGKIVEADSLPKGTESPRTMEDKGNLHVTKRDVERRIQERMTTQASSVTSCQQQDSSCTRGAVVGNHLDDVDTSNMPVGRPNQSSVVGPNSWAGFAGANEASKGPPQISTIQHELPIERRENIPSQFQNVVNNCGSRNHSLSSFSLKEQWKSVPGTESDPHGATMMKDGNVMIKHVSPDGFKTVPVDNASKHGISFATEQDGNERLVSGDLSPSPKYTMSERWIMDQQRKRLLVEQKWVQKQQKTKQRMATSFHKLKENVSSSEDISAKTKSVIELKKLQLLELQRRLRSALLTPFLNYYWESREKLDDVFKIKRERWKGFNRYVKEFHKRKERIHREKIDRIQREKINLLKINDVEGYLRMVQDAKSDRVKQLLKETEKYLQKLGSKLQEAKAAAGRFGQEVDDTGHVSFLENSETENEDESDQAKASFIIWKVMRSIIRWLTVILLHSKEFYYPCSIKESIAEQPSSLQGGKLREYQMNGLRWLVSLYNNHLNGILADEMGLGKTVQVISLICYLMETKNDRGPFLVVVPSSVLPGWDSEINFWAPGVHKINNLEELWALLNFLLPNIFNSSEDFSQWFNKPFESAGDSSPDERVEENLGSIGSSKARSVHNSVMELRNICNHPYLSQLHAEEVDNFIPKHYLPPIIRLCGKLEMLDRLLPKLKAADHRVLFFSTMTRLLDVMEEYLTLKQYRYLRLDGHTSGGDRGALIELFNQPDSPYFIFLLSLSSFDTSILHISSGHLWWCAGGHLWWYVTILQLLSLVWVAKSFLEKRWFGSVRSIRAGGVGVNLQAADTVDLQAQARAHRIGQKRDVLVLRFETVQTVEEQVRASAEHKLGVANQSITAGFFDNNTSAEDRREYLEALLRECKKEEAAPVLDDDALNDVLARSIIPSAMLIQISDYRHTLYMVLLKPLIIDKIFNETELDIFEAVDKKRKEDELATWKKLVHGQTADGSDLIPPPPTRLVTDEDLKQFYEAMKISDVPKVVVESSGVKRKGGYLGGLDTQQYGRGKRAREVRSYEEQWTEEEFEKMCQVEAPDSPKVKEVAEMSYPTNTSSSIVSTSNPEPEVAVSPVAPTLPSVESLPVQQAKEITPPAKRGRGRPKRITSDKSPAVMGPPVTSGTVEVDTQLQKGSGSGHLASSAADSVSHSSEVTSVNASVQQSDTGVSPNARPAIPVPTIPPNSQVAAVPVSVSIQARGPGRKNHGSEGIRRRGKKQVMVPPPVPGGSVGPDVKVNEKLDNKLVSPSGQAISQGEVVPSLAAVAYPSSASSNSGLGAGTVLNSQAPHPSPSNTTLVHTITTHPSEQMPSKGQNQKSQTGVSRRRGKKQAPMLAPVPDVLHEDSDQTANLPVSSGSAVVEKATELKSLQVNNVPESKCVVQDQASQNLGDQDLKSLEGSDDSAKQTVITPSCQDSMTKFPGKDLEKVKNLEVHDASVKIVKSSEITSSKVDEVCNNSRTETSFLTTVPVAEATKDQISGGKTHTPTVETTNIIPSVVDTPTNTDAINKSLDPVNPKIVPSTLSTINPSTPASESTLSGSIESIPSRRQGRKTQNRAEPPRRRGKKSASVLPVVPDAVTGQDPKLSHHAQNSSGDSLQGKATANISQTQSFEILLPSGVVSHESKRKDRTTNSTQNKQMKVTRIDSAPISADKISVHDVARVMKEVFSGTCLPKPKAHDSAGSEDKNSTVGHVMTKAAVCGSNNHQTLEDKARCDITSSGAACLTSDAVVNVPEKQSEPASSMPNLEGKANLNMPTTGEHSLLSDVKEKDEQTQHCVENSITECKIALDPTVSAVEKTGGYPEKLPTSDLSIDSSSHQICSSSSAGSLVVIDHNKLGDQSDVSEECLRPSALDIGGPGCTLTPLEPKTSSNNHESTQTDMCTQSHSSTNKRLDDTEQISTEKLDTDSSGLLVKTENLGDQPQVTSSSPATGPLPSTVIVSIVSKQNEVKNETEFALKASAELSSDDGIVGCKIPDSELLKPENPIIFEHDSQKPLEPPVKQCSESASEMEDPVGAKAVKIEKHSNALEPDLDDTPLIESCAKILSEEKKDDVNFICEQLQSGSQENIVLPNPIDNPKTSSEACHVEIDTSDRLVLPQPSGLEAVGNDLRGDSGVGSFVEGTISEGVVLSQSTMVEEQNRGSEPLEESMEKDVANNSGFQEEVKVDEVEADGLMNSSISQTVLVKHDAFQENMNLSSHPMTKEENIEGSTVRSLSISISPSDGLKDSKSELGHKDISAVGNSQIGSEDSMLKSLGVVSSPSVRKEEGFSSTPDIDGLEGQSVSLRVPVSSNDLLGKSKFHQLITVPDAVEPSLSQLKEEEKIGVLSDCKLVVGSVSEKDIEGSGLLPEDPVLEINKTSSDSPIIVTDSSEAQVSLVKGDCEEVRMSDQMDVSEVSRNDSERFSSNSQNDPSCLQMERDNANVLSDRGPLFSSFGPGERYPLIENCRDDIMEPIANPLLQNKSECSESEKVEMNTSDVGCVDPELVAKSTDLPSSLMEEDKADISCRSPLAGAEPMTGGNCEDASEEPNRSEAEIGNQMDASDAGVNTEQLSSGDVIEPSSSLIIEDNKIVLSSVKVPHLTEEGSCKDSREGPSTNPVLLQELNNNSEAEICDQGSTQVGETPVDVVKASEVEREVKTLSDEGPQGIFETQVESRGVADSEVRTDSKSCATEIENVSEVPNSSVSVEQVDDLSNEGIVGSQSIMQVSEDSEAIAGVEIDVTPDCLDPSVSVEKVDGLSNEGIVGSQPRMQVSEDSEAIAGVEIDVTPDCLDPPVSVEKVDGLSNEGIVGSQPRMQVSEDSEAIAGDGIDVTPDCLDPSVTVEKVEGLSKEGLLCIQAKVKVSEDSEAVMGDGIDITPGCLAVPETVTIVEDSSICSSTVGSEHVDNLSEANIDTKESKAEVDTKESESGVCNQENQVVQEKASECREREKDLDGNTSAKLDPKESEAGDCNQDNEEKTMKDIEKSTPVAEGSS
ncbi:Chromatin structure-remodeling complex protein [Vigna angularis]|uniref:Chromatin structure-remodeling complex protein n=1 Tax=Phaseolus angularis TaxID=3914 RepID=A0A8T0L6I1_PHAAN|nr:Chromatin structure-remodeling complex protein [Vigna angularis]